MYKSHTSYYFHSRRNDVCAYVFDVFYACVFDAPYKTCASYVFSFCVFRHFHWNLLILDWKRTDTGQDIGILTVLRRS